MTALIITFAVLAAGSRVAEWVLVRDRPLGLKPEGIYAVVFWVSLAAVIVLLATGGDGDTLTRRTPY